MHFLLALARLLLRSVKIDGTRPQTTTFFPCRNTKKAEYIRWEGHFCTINPAKNHQILPIILSFNNSKRGCVVTSAWRHRPTHASIRVQSPTLVNGGEAILEHHRSKAGFVKPLPCQRSPKTGTVTDKRTSPLARRTTELKPKCRIFRTGGAIPVLKVTHGSLGN